MLWSHRRQGARLFFVWSVWAQISVFVIYVFEIGEDSNMLLDSKELLVNIVESPNEDDYWIEWFVGWLDLCVEIDGGM